MKFSKQRALSRNGWDAQLRRRDASYAFPLFMYDCTCVYSYEYLTFVYVLH